MTPLWFASSAGGKPAREVDINPNEVLPAFVKMPKERIKLVPTHLLVLLPALERRDNILVESRGDGLGLDDFGRRRRRFEQAVIFMGVAVLAA